MIRTWIPSSFSVSSMEETPSTQDRDVRDKYQGKREYIEEDEGRVNRGRGRGRARARARARLKADGNI